MPILRTAVLLASFATFAQAGTLSMSAVSLAMPLTVAELNLAPEPLDFPANEAAGSVSSEEPFRQWLQSDEASHLVIEPNFVEDADATATPWVPEENTSSAIVLVPICSAALYAAFRAMQRLLFASRGLPPSRRA